MSLSEIETKLNEVINNLDEVNFIFDFLDAYNQPKATINRLKKGGIIIFDDFLWNYYKDPNLNPIGGIKKFLSEHFFKVKIISISYQFIIMKL